ncbi:MAG: class II aldolase/adducin family protein [Comamonadaceae bacterium]|nr:class II aldolase/adducin family protein [Comamonadaceae bacterium]
MPYDALTARRHRRSCGWPTARATGRCVPSSEWRFHRDIYARAARSSRAIVHTHSPFATALACHGRGIPAFHYMVARRRRQRHPLRRRTRPSARRRCPTTRCAALDGRRACLLAHHGVIACGDSLDGGAGAGRSRSSTWRASTCRRAHAGRAAAAARRTRCSACGTGLPATGSRTHPLNALNRRSRRVTGAAARVNLPLWQRRGT